MTYEEQLKTSAWLRKKFEVMDRDGFVCSNCLCDNSERTLSVHHIAYFMDKKAWEYPDYMLVTLCEDFHNKEHVENNIYKPKKIKQWLVKLLTPFKHT